MSDKSIIRIVKALCVLNGIKEYSSPLGEQDECFVMTTKDMYDKKSLTGFNFCSSIYPFTNENIADYYGIFDFENKKILTVCGSGDHVLNAVLLGAKEIDCFDISMFVEPYLDLKIAAIKALTYEEFLDFFVFGIEWFNLNLYSKIHYFLSEESKMFWDSLYLECDRFDIKNIKETNLFCRDSARGSEAIAANLYLQEKNYYILRERLEKCKINFENLDFLKLKTKFSDKYDFIGLSNIYGRMVNKGTNLYKGVNKTLFELSKSLNKNGILIINYEWTSGLEVEPEINDLLSENNEIMWHCFKDVRRYGQNSIVYCRRR